MLLVLGSKITFKKQVLKFNTSFLFCFNIFPATKQSLNENHAIIQENLTYCTKNPIACLRGVHYISRIPEWDLIYETETEEITRDC